MRDAIRFQLNPLNDHIYKANRQLARQTAPALSDRSNVLERRKIEKQMSSDKRQRSFKTY
jgi:hypothetical protein